jgi:hypothetical protein
VRGRRVAWLALPLMLAFTAGDLRDQRAELARRADVSRGIEALAPALRACRPVRTGRDQRTVVARVARESIPDAAARPRPGDATVRLLPSGRWVLKCSRP